MMKTKIFERYTVDYSEDLDIDNLNLIADVIFPLAHLNFDFNSLDSRILIAHGSSEDQYRSVHYPRNGANFSNNSIYAGTREKIQDWVDMYDGKHNLLAVVSCNTHDKPLTSQKSILIYPRVIISIKKFYESMQDFYSGREQSNISVHIPESLRKMLIRDQMKAA